ncbi:MAG TPA: serine/threonine-protein kinase, partial [Polyangiaceae bacterium]|nr:serine/threonine-protein kinase [Polyangiaceae bacterium]
MNSRPPSALWPPLAGTRIAGRFELGALVASGGMGTVHRAVDLTNGQSVALKLLADVGAPDAAARFEREARLLAELDHPSIVRFVDAGVADGGQLYLAMEWLDGEDLSRRLVRGPLSVADAVGVARRVAEGLSVAHAAGIVHRDIKPHNVFLLEGRLDRLKIVDFGIALVAGAKSGITRTGMTIGTPEYMAPEQARGERGLDAKVDVYALGCLIYQAIVGAPPFVGPTPVSVVAELLLSEAPRVGSRARGVPAELDELVAAMLSKDPAARPADGRAVAARLVAIEARPGLAVLAPPGSMSHEERRLVSVVAVLSDDEVPSNPDVTVPLAALSGIDAHLAAIARRAGAEPSPLPDRGALLAFSEGEAASDLAIRAARAGHEIAIKLGR